MKAERAIAITIEVFGTSKVLFVYASEETFGVRKTPKVNIP